MKLENIVIVTVKNTLIHTSELEILIANTKEFRWKIDNASVNLNYTSIMSNTTIYFSGSGSLTMNKNDFISHQVNAVLEEILPGWTTITSKPLSGVFIEENSFENWED